MEHELFVFDCCKCDSTKKTTIGSNRHSLKQPRQFNEDFDFFGLFNLKKRKECETRQYRININIYDPNNNVAFVYKNIVFPFEYFLFYDLQLTSKGINTIYDMTDTSNLSEGAVEVIALGLSQGYKNTLLMNMILKNYKIIAKHKFYRSIYFNFVNKEEKYSLSRFNDFVEIFCKNLKLHKYTFEIRLMK